MGKTSTAECVAASTNRPLFHIACGDIGHEVWQVENNLRDLFDLVYRWGCILLLEEADVFLAKRNENFSRNSIVSVFLRVLEYYSGILFLTTNHVGSIDDAFHSRFHLMLYYPRLSKRQSCKVWEINLDNLEEQSKIRIQSGRPGIKMDRTKILAYANNSYERLSWNGRQIRNAFQTALALAESRVRNKEAEEPVVGTDGFRIIAASVDNFGYCVKQALYQDQNRIVHHDRTRTDDSALKYWLRNRTKYESSYHDDEDEDTAQIWQRNNSGSPMDESDSAGSDSLDESSDAYARRESSRIKSKAKGKKNIGNESRNRKDWERRKDEGGFQR